MALAAASLSGFAAFAGPRADRFTEALLERLALRTRPDLIVEDGITPQPLLMPRVTRIAPAVSLTGMAGDVPPAARRILFVSQYGPLSEARCVALRAAAQAPPAAAGCLAETPAAVVAAIASETQVEASPRMGSSTNSLHATLVVLPARAPPPPDAPGRCAERAGPSRPAEISTRSARCARRSSYLSFATPMKLFRNLASRPRPRQHRIPPGKRIYAIGDVHGRADLLEALLDAIARDDAGRSQSDTELIFLGDLVDRGPDSAAVVARVRALCEQGVARLLKGNHEEVFVNAVHGETRSARGLIGIGGLATLKSYGISEEEANDGSFEDLVRLLRRRIPAADIAFLDDAENMIVIGDYLFVHAGIRPGVRLEEQKISDLRWIRDAFLASKADHGLMVVHGHSITRDVDAQPNRVGIDTGAFFSGRLSALGIEDTERWVVSVAGRGSGVRQRPRRRLIPAARAVSGAAGGDPRTSGGRRDDASSSAPSPPPRRCRARGCASPNGWAGSRTG